AAGGAAPGAGPPAQNGSLQGLLDGLQHAAQGQGDPGVQKLFELVPGLEGALQGPDAGWGALLALADAPWAAKLNAEGADGADGAGGATGSEPHAGPSRDADGHEKVDLGDGLVLTRLEPGDNRTSPVDGDQVSLEYAAYSNFGTPVALERDDDIVSLEFDTRALEPLNFTLGDQAAIPGLARAARRMTLGERALVSLPEQLLYPVAPTGDLSSLRTTCCSST
ncbi:unnamed protein product, partial [Prorocentrum cordatum]